MKFALLVLFAAGALSAPRYDFSNWEDSLVSKEPKCGDLERLSSEASTIYDYEGETRNTIQGSTPDDTGLLIKARIYIHPKRSCRFAMQINEVELKVKSKTQSRFTTASESKKFRRELQAQELAFKISDGKILKLFPSPAETNHVLNVKRGILSTLQLGRLETTEEVDVNGRCKVKYIEKDGIILKSKNISECSERALNEVGFQTTSFQKNDLPIKPLQSTSTCSFETVRNKIRAVNCREEHIFRPFSAGYESPSGAMTIVRQKVTFVAEKAGHGSVKDVLETESKLGVSLIYSHEKEEIKPDENIVERIDSVMKNLVQSSRVGDLATKQSSAHDFTKLVELVRKLDKKRMTAVWDKYFDCVKSGACKENEFDVKSICRQYLLDALTYCGTPTCIYTVHNVIVDGEVTGANMNTFLQGISLITKPTKAMIRDVLSIVKNKPSRQSFLTLGTLMHRYCTANPTGCNYDKRNPIIHAELFLENKLGKSCAVQEDHDRVEEILMTLKAIGNAGRPMRAFKTILRCAQTALHQNVSFAAFDALRRMPCNQGILNQLHKVHENIDIDPERRIHAYLALMKCPSENTLKRVCGQLDRETSRQVGSFMASHLKNLNDSSDPRHEMAQKILATVLKAKTLSNFNLVPTRYSRAWEGSLHSKYLKSGGSVDGHLIFSPNSYIPRSALLNVTATILDVPVNVLEMAARVEGVESLIEDIFGPDGYFPDNNVLKLFNITITKDDIERLRRSRRNANDDSMDENIADLHKRVNQKRVRPSGSLNMKIFGHDMSVFSYDDIFWAVDRIDNMNVIDLLLKFAKGGHKTFTKSMMFLEMTHTVPTGLGLPLKLKLTGSAVGSLELNGKFDIRNMFWGPSSMEIKGYIRPSAVVELAGQMGVHSHYVDSGIFVNTSVLTSQMLKGSIVYKEGQTLQINIDAPEKPVQLFNVSSTPFLFLNEEADLIQGSPRRLSPDFCINSTMILGLGLCTRLSVPVAFREYESPYFPLSGPSSFGMNLIKADPKLTSYQMSINLKKTNNELLGWFELGTPGATYSRRLAGLVKYVETGTSRTLTVGSFEGGMINGEFVRNKVEFMVSYHNNTNRFEMDFRSNLLTKKTMKMKFLYFNDTHFLGRQMGVLMSAEYDWYKFQHVVKYIKKTTSYLLQSKTTYWPEKHLTGEIEVVPATQSIAVRFNANQFDQSIEMLGKYIKTENERGLNFLTTHKKTMVKGSFYVGLLNEPLTKLLIINGTALGKTAVLKWGYYIKDMLREMRFDVNMAGRTMALFAKYNRIQEGLLDARLGASVGGKTIALFANYNRIREGSLDLKIGASVGEYKVGLSTEYMRSSNSFDRELCSFMFYNEKVPVKTCLALKKIPASWGTPEYKRLTLTSRILGKTVLTAIDYKNNDGKYSLTTSTMYGEKFLFKNYLEFTYDTIWNTQLKMTTEVGKKTVSSRWFSAMVGKDLCTFGVEATGLNQKVKLMATYSKEMKEGTIVHGIIFEGWVNKKLPMSYKIILELGNDIIMGLSSTLNVKSYMMKASMLWLRPEANKYSGVYDFQIAKEDFTIFRNKLTDILVWDVRKAYKLMWEITIWNKKFEYGWDFAYQDYSTASKMAHTVTFGLNYARGRRASVTTTLANSAKIVKLTADVEYLPGRQVSHVIQFNKEARQLDIVLEFLPRMFVKLMGKLDRIDGWRITTDLTFNWVNYNRVLRWMAAYINKVDAKGLSFQFSAYGKQFFTGFEFNKNTKTGVWTISALGRSLKLVGFCNLDSRGRAGFRIVAEKSEGDMITSTEVIESLITYDKDNGRASIELKTPSKSLMKIAGHYDRYRNLGSIEVFGLERSLMKILGSYDSSRKIISVEVFSLQKSLTKILGQYDSSRKIIAIEVFGLQKSLTKILGQYDNSRKIISVEVFGLQKSLTKIVGQYDSHRKIISVELFGRKRSLVKAIGQYKTYEKTVSFRMFMLGKERFQAIGKYDQEQKSVFLSLDALKKNMNIMFGAKWDPVKKQISFSTEVSGRVFGFIARLDPRKYISSFHVFYQKNLAGVSMYLDKKNKALVYNVTLTPRLSGQVMIEIAEDRMIKFVIQHKIGGKIINETVLRYELTSDSSKLGFQWNKDTIKKMKDMVTNAVVSVTPFVEAGVKNITTIARKAHLLSKKFSMELVRNLTTQVLRLINEIDRRFDEFDFVAARDKIGVTAATTLKTVARLTSKSLEKISHLLTKMHENLPTAMEQVQSMTRKVQKIARKVLEQTRLLSQEVKKMSQEVKKISVLTYKLAYKVAKNLTESGIPVVKTAIKLAKEFKIRGQTMEQLVQQVIEMVRKLSKTWKKNVSLKLAELKKNVSLKLGELKKNAKEYVTEIRIPYRSEKVGEMYTKLVAELMKRTDNFNLKKTVEKIVKMVMEYEIRGKPIKEHLVPLRKKVDELRERVKEKVEELRERVKEKVEELPDIIKTTTKDLIGKVRVHVKNAKKFVLKYVNEVKYFSLPLVNHLKKISASVNKHFSPLVRKAMKKIQIFVVAEFKKMYQPAKLRITELVNFLEKFFMPLLKPFRPLFEDWKNQIRGIRLLEQEIGAVLDSYMEELKFKGKLKLEELKNSYEEMINKVEEVIKSLMELKPEKAVEKAVDNAIILGKKTTVYLKNLYVSRMEILKTVEKTVHNVVEIAKDAYDLLTSKPVEDLIYTTFIKAGESVEKTLKHAVKILDQIAMIEIIRPLERFWKDLDLLTHLGNYGVNDRITKVIDAAKAVNLTETIFNTIYKLRKFAIDVISKAEKKLEAIYGKSLAIYGQTLRVYRYLVSIPRKDFEEFYNDVESFVLKHKMDLSTFMSKTYSLAMKRLQKTMELLKNIYNESYETYAVPIKNWYRDIKDRALMVYGDNKEDSVEVYNYYKDIFVGILKEQLSKINAKMEIMKTKLEILKIRLEAKLEMLKNRLQEKYDELYRKALALYDNYADMTWEEIGANINDYGQKRSEIALAYGKVKLEKAKILANRVIKLAKEVYKNTTILTRKAIAYVKNTVQTVVRPRALEMYRKAVDYVRKNARIFHKKSSELLKENKALILDWYMDHKDKSFRTLYHDARAIVMIHYRKSTDKAREMLKTYYGRILARISQLKGQMVSIKDKVLPILKEEAESVINQTLRSAVILVNETVKAYSPHYAIVKDHAIVYFNKGKAKAAELYAVSKVRAADLYAMSKVRAADLYAISKVRGAELFAMSKERSIELYEKALAVMKAQTKKLIKLLNELLQRIKTHPTYRKVISHELVIRATKWLKDFSEKLGEKMTEVRKKMEELRNHPKVIELKEKLEEKISELREKLNGKVEEYREKLKDKVEEYREKLKDKVEEYREKLQEKLEEYKELLNEYKKHPKIEQLLDALKKIKESGFYTLLSLKQKASPHVQRLQKSIAKVPELALWKINNFYQYPEECFWTTVKDLTTLLDTLRSHEWSTIHKRMWSASKDLLREITDEQTKGTALSIVDHSKMFYKKALQQARQVPEWLKKQSAILRKHAITYCTNKWNWLNEQWKNCHLYPIVNHEIWRELAEEFLNHEILLELKNLALEGRKLSLECKDKAIEYKDKIITYAKLRKAELQEQISKLIKKLDTKVNTFLDETTMEHVVLKAIELFERSKNFVNIQKDKLVQKLKEHYRIANEKFVNHYTRAKTIADKYIEKAKTIWEDKYPKLAKKAELVLRNARTKAEILKKKYTELAREMKKEYTRKLLKLWNESELKQRMLALKKMTVRQTVEKIKKLPELTKTVVKKLYNKALSEVKARYELYLLPHVQKAERSFLIVFNELNETAVFIYRYYKLNDHFYRMKNYLNDTAKNLKTMTVNEIKRIKTLTESQIRRIAPKVPIAIKEYLKKLCKHGLKALHTSLVFVDNVDIKPYLRKMKTYIPDVKKYVILDTNKGELVLSIPHFRSIEPSFTHHIKKAARQIQNQIENVNRTVRMVSGRVIKNTIAATKLMLEKIKAKTHELRKDLNASILVHKKLGLHLLDKAKVIGDQAKVIGIDYYNKVNVVSKDMYNKALKKSKEVIKKAKKVAAEISALTERSLLDIYNSDSLPEAYQKTKAYGRLIVDEAKRVLVPYYRNAELYVKESEVYKKALRQAKEVLEKAKTAATKIYAITENSLLDIYNSDSIPEAYQKTKAYGRLIVDETKRVLMPYYRNAELYAKQLYGKMKIEYQKVIYKIRPYSIMVKTAIRDWRDGAEFRTAFRVVEQQLRKTYRALKADYDTKIADLRTKIAELKELVKDSIDEDTLKLLEEYMKTHKNMLGKYGRRFYKLYKLTKSRLDRAIRIAKIMVGKYWRKPIEAINPYRSVAMIFGKSHVMTFDSKYYDFPAYSKPHCTYLLARDFQRGKFTVLSQQEHLIALTPDMKVKIHMNGKVESVVKTVRSGRVAKETMQDLPVQSETGFCKREGSYIVCEFNQGLRITCDQEHFLCTVELSAMDYAKSRGLLGTNNHETYDEMKLPDGTITQSIAEFANAWEVSGDSECRIREPTSRISICNKASSEKCFDLLKEKTSFYAPLFGIVNPAPYLKACQIDSSDCETKEPYETSHCNATAAYVHMLRLKGIWVPFPKDCARYTTASGKAYSLGDKWVQPSSKDLDVVVMISERKKIRSMRRTIASLIVNVNRNMQLSGHATRFALIGFGGHGVHESAHLHTPSGRIFTNAAQIATTIKTMPYTGTTDNMNDAFDAMLLASKLKYRPSAARVFVLFNSDMHKPSWFGPTEDETIMSVKYESNATLFAFDNFNFKSVDKSVVVGQTQKRVYLYPNEVLPLTTDFPESPFTKLVKLTRGGMFSSKLKPLQEKIMETAITDSLLEVLKINSQNCKSCVLTRGCAGQGIPMCRSNSRKQC